MTQKIKKKTAKKKGRNDTPDTPLYHVLDAAFPKLRNTKGGLSIRHLAYPLDVTTTSVYRWIETNKLPPNLVSKLIELSEGKLTPVKLLPFLYS